jgi:flagellar assembly protein FliH
MAWRRLGDQVGPACPSSEASVEIAIADPETLRAQLARLMAESDAREKTARQQGFQAGEAAAVQKAEQQYRQAMQRLAQSVEEMLATRLRIRQQMEEDLVHLAVEVARRILHRELTVDPEALLGVVKAAIQKIDARELHRVRVAGADARLVQDCLASLNLPARVEVTADPGLPRGSVVLETARGTLDSSVETQLQEIDRGFADLVRRQSS